MIISWNVTKECNLHCEHCYRSSGPEAKQKDELNTREGKKLLSEIAKAGFRIIIFSGGEPLLRDDIFELVTHAREQNLRPVFGSNGTLITPEIAHHLKEVNTAAVGISLDSIEQEKHDRFRGVQGSWEKAVRGIKNCREAGIPVQINSTIMNYNYQEIDKIIDLAVKLGVRSYSPFFLVPTGRGQEIEKDSVTPDRYHQLIEYIMHKRTEVDLEIKPTCAPQFLVVAEQMGLNLRYTRGCLAGISYCCILPDGRVDVCPYLSLQAGHVREKPFDEIWDNSEVFAELRSENYSGNCGRCDHTDICGGCRARAFYYQEGDFMAGDSWCQVGDYSG